MYVDEDKISDDSDDFDDASGDSDIIQPLM